MLDAYGYANGEPTNYRDPTGRGGEGTAEDDPTEPDYRDNFGQGHDYDPEGGPADVQVAQANAQAGLELTVGLYVTTQIASIPMRMVPFLDGALKVAEGDYSGAWVSGPGSSSFPLSPRNEGMNSTSPATRITDEAS